MDFSKRLGISFKRNILDPLYTVPLKFLNRIDAVRIQILVYIFAVHLHNPVVWNYNRLYGTTDEERETLIARSKSIVEETDIGVYRRRELSRLSEIIHPDQQRRLNLELQQQKGPIASYPRDHELKWRHFPEFHWAFRLLRTLSTLWMVYILLKYAALDLYGRQLYERLGIDYPLHCLLVGRYIIHEKFADLTACVWAISHVFWRFTLRFAKRPFKISSLYFLLLDGKDLRLFYSKLGGLKRTFRSNDGDKLGDDDDDDDGDDEDNHSLLEFEHSLAGHSRSCIELTMHEVGNLSQRELFMLETMCFRIDKPTRVLYVLRSNRTLECHAKMRQLVAHLTYLSIISIAVIGLFIFVNHSLTIMLDSRYLRVYNNCDSHLQYLNDTGQLSAWSMTPTLHHVVSGYADVLENVVLWVEGGLVCILGPGFTVIVNYDLILYWQNLAQRIDQLQVVSKTLYHASSLETRDAPVVGRPNTLMDDSIRELQAEIADFFRQVKRSDLYVSDVLNVALVGWVNMSALYTYFTQMISLKLPVGVIIVLGFVYLVITFICLSFLSLHRNCNRSYPSICSLMAYDRTKSRKSYGLIMEMYFKKMSCFTLFHQYPFKPTTFITIVGYSFSSFFLVAGLFKDRRFGGARGF